MITLQEVYFYAKVIGSIGSAGAALYGAFRYLLTGYNQRKKTQETVELLATNHLPHIQKSLDSQDEVLKTLTSDMKSMETRLEDTRAGVHSLGQAFIAHLEKVSVEPKQSKRKKR